MSMFVTLAKTDRRMFDVARRKLRKESRQMPEALTLIADNSQINEPLPKGAPIKAWRNKEFLVQLYDQEGHSRLSINRSDVNKDGNWKEGISWDQLMKLKNQAGFEDQWAVEVFPPDSSVVNVANIRHLFLLPEAPEFAWRKEEA